MRLRVRVEITNRSKTKGRSKELGESLTTKGESTRNETEGGTKVVVVGKTRGYDAMTEERHCFTNSVRVLTKNTRFCSATTASRELSEGGWVGGKERRTMPNKSSRTHKVTDRPARGSASVWFPCGGSSKGRQSGLYAWRWREASSTPQNRRQRQQPENAHPHS